MRLRLRIERNALPPSQALWPVKDGKSTIAQLVQQINGVFPLEGDTWGLEDYSVSVGGYECLHYHEVAAVCKEDDELVIKPLQYVEVRARTLTGRAQISADGRHLVDGVPFGKPCLKAPTRPDVKIPPRKRRKLFHGGDEEEDGGQLLLKENGEELDNDDDEEDDVDFDVKDSGDNSSSDESTESDSESEDSDESGSDKSDTSSSESDSDDSSDSDSVEPWSGIPASEPPTPKSKNASNLTNGTTENHAIGPSAGEKRKRQSHEEDHEADDHREIKAVKADKGPPGEDQSRSKDRNARRRDARKLKHLKKMQVLPESANLESLRQWEDENPSVKLLRQEDGTIKKFTEDGPMPMRAREDIVAVPEAESEVVADVQMPDASKEVTDHAPAVERESSQTAKELKKAKKDAWAEARRKNLLPAVRAQYANTNGEEKDADPPQELSSKQEPAPLPDASATETTEDEVPERLSAAQRSSRLALKQLGPAAKRLIFGSLGVSVPKTKEEKEQVSKKLADGRKRNVFLTDQGGAPVALAELDGKAAADAQPQTDGLEPEGEDTRDWTEKINLTAVECCEEGVTLSTPPFPFQQRWDPQQRKKKIGGRNSRMYSDERRGKKHAQYVDETYDKYNTYGYGDALDYDDPAGEEDEYWEEGALLNGDYGEEAEAEEEANDANDGFPTLPANLDELPALEESDARKDDFIAFTELACDESTVWEPKMASRTAKIVDAPTKARTVGEDVQKHWVLQLPSRPKVFDQDGNRVYTKFEMPNDDEPAEDEGKREVSWSELGVVRLVLRLENSEVDGEV